MEHRGTVLLVDDNEKFVSATSTLFKRHGFACDCAYDGTSAVRLLEEKACDVLVADIRMQGNERLELIEKVGKSHEGLPVILITGHPSVDTAVQAIGMPVVAYLVKPFEFKDLLHHVELAVMRSRLAGRISACRRRFDEIEGSLLGLEGLVSEMPADKMQLPLDMFLDLTTRNLIDCIADITQLMRSNRQQEEGHVCRLYHCPRLELMKSCLKESVEVLERTKNAFKSKELAQLRKTIEDVLSKI